MAIVKRTEGGNLERRAGMKVASKAAKHPAKKAAKKAAAKKVAAKHAEKHAAKHVGPESDSEHLAKAFHHLERAAAVISLLESGSGGDLRTLLDHGIRVYCNAISSKPGKGAAVAAHGLLRAAEHLALAGLYAARADHRAEVPVTRGPEIDKKSDKAAKRLDHIGPARGATSKWLIQLASELLARAQTAEPHLEWEFVMAADGIGKALEEGM